MTAAPCARQRGWEANSSWFRVCSSTAQGNCLKSAEAARLGVCDLLQRQRHASAPATPRPHSPPPAARTAHPPAPVHCLPLQRGQEGLQIIKQQSAA